MIIVKFWIVITVGAVCHTEPVKQIICSVRGIGNPAESEQHPAVGRGMRFAVLALHVYVCVVVSFFVF